MIWSLQVLRFVAAALVVYLHATQYATLATANRGAVPDWITALASVGVDIFFVLSGVVIAKTAAGMTPAEFAWRRVRRVMPIYLICSVPAFLIAAPHGITWRDMLASVLLWPATDVITAPLLPVAWTLCYEMLFYAATTIWLVHRGLGFALLAGYVAALALRSHGPVFQFVGNPLVIEFLLGVVIARVPPVRRGLLSIPLGVAALICAGLVADPPASDPVHFFAAAGGGTRLLTLGIPAALIVYGTMHVRARESAWTQMGEASYSIYLTHLTILTGLLLIWRDVGAPHHVITLIGFVASLLVAWRIHELIERPLLNAMPKQLGRRSCRDAPRRAQT